MRLGLKKIFSRIKSKAQQKGTTKTPEGKGVPATPPTQPVKEDTRDDGPLGDYYELPVKNLLEDLNIAGTSDLGDTELVLGSMDVPDDEPPMEPQDEPYSWDHLPSQINEDIEETTTEDEEEKTTTEQIEITPPWEADIKRDDEDLNEDLDQDLDQDLNETDDEEDEEGEDSFLNAPLRPRQLALSSENFVNTIDDLSVNEESETESKDKENVGSNQKAGMDVGKQVSSTIMGFFEKAKECASGMMGGEPSVQNLLIPTAENALCQPMGGTRSRSDVSTERPNLVRQYSYYNEQFAHKILDELINVGYALVHHRQEVDTEMDDDGDWVGRSVTLILRPGICNAMQVVAPQLEWSTLGGGLQGHIETNSVSLLDIHSISTSSAEDRAVDDDGNEKSDGSPEEADDLQCFFSLTTKQGQIHVMEAITADESQRLVAGVRNLVPRFTRLLIAGDNMVLSDFFDNSQEPEEIRVTEDEAMHRISHAFLDHISGS